MSGTYLLQPGDDARAEYLHTGRNVLYFRFFRMWGTFECFSNIRLSVTPSGNFSVFYPVIYIIVLESIQLSGLVAIHISDWANWQYMHWLVIGLLAVVWLCVFFLHVPSGWPARCLCMA